MSAVLRLPAPAMRTNRATFPQASSAAASAMLRDVIADEIDRLVALLDAIDGDFDAEDDGAAEPSLGWTKMMALGTADDREEGETAP